MDKIHSLLKRQLKKYFGDPFIIPNEWQAFIDAVNNAYFESDGDRAMLERSLELSSQELMQANSELRAIFQAIPDQLFTIDLNGKILNCKTGTTSDLLVHSKELMGKLIQDIQPKAVGEKFYNAICQVKETKKITNIEYSLAQRQKDAFFEARFVPMLEEQIVVIIRNITEQKRAEKALRESEEKFRTLYENSTIGIYRTTPDGRVLMANPTAVKMLGYDSFEELSKHNLEIDGYEASYNRKAFRDRLQKDGVIKGLESVWIRKNSSKIHIRESTKAIFDELGNVIYYDGTIEDITEWKRAEEALRESEEKFHILAENSPVGIFQTDAAGVTIYVNPKWCEISGMTMENALGYGWLDSVHEDDREKILSGWKNATHSHESSDAEYRFVRKNGTIAWVIGRAVPKKDAENNIVGYVGTITDITERKIAEEQINKMNEELEVRVIERTLQLEAANKELEAFAYSASHDLRAPLRAIDGFAHILAEDYNKFLDEEGKRVCSVICNEAKRMGRLIDDLLSFSRIGHSKMELISINVEAMVFSVFYELTVHKSRDRIEFQVTDLPSAIGDPTLLREIWVNLISNAIKFSSKKEKSIIKVSGRRDGSELIYSICDNGVGFDMQYANKLFCVFQRLHSEEEFEGTGVGLAIVQRLVHRHGGRIWANAEIDKGAEFHFSLNVR